MNCHNFPLPPKCLWRRGKSHTQTPEITSSIRPAAYHKQGKTGNVHNSRALGKSPSRSALASSLGRPHLRLSLKKHSNTRGDKRDKKKVRHRATYIYSHIKVASSVCQPCLPAMSACRVCLPPANLSCHVITDHQIGSYRWGDGHTHGNTVCAADRGYSVVATKDDG